MNFSCLYEASDFNWSTKFAAPQFTTPKTLVDTEEQVLTFLRNVYNQKNLQELKNTFQSDEDDLGTGQQLVIGVDCEGISRNRNLSLIQVSTNDLCLTMKQVGFSGHCYIFDLLKVNPFPIGLKKILEDRDIVKVFHDFCEDTSALVRQFEVHCDGVFDTQIAHRFLSKGSDDPKDSNISLNSFLAKYLGVENNQKDAIVNLMNTDPDFWWKVRYFFSSNSPLETSFSRNA